MTIPKKAEERLVNGIKKFLPILVNAKTRNDAESDTARIVTDILGEVFGYDKYTELTSEHGIKGTVCDLAIKLGNGISALIEVKAIGTALKDAPSKKTTEFGTNNDIEWVILTNGLSWKIFRIILGEAISTQIVEEINLETDDIKRDETLQSLFLIAKEGWSKNALPDYHQQKETINKFFLAGLLQTEPMGDAIRKEIKRINPEIKITSDQILKMLKEDVIKRDTLEGEKAAEVQNNLQKTQVVKGKTRNKPVQTEPTANPEETPVVTEPVAEPSTEPAES